MKKFFSVLGLLCCYHWMYAQTPASTSVPPSQVTASLASVAKGRISGTVTDAASNEPVPFATAALIPAGSKTPLDGAVADENGKFTISKVAAGEYKLAISFLGYEEKILDNITVSDSKGEVNLGTIQLNPTVQELKEITVQGQKNLIEEKVDRMVYNAENDATNRGGDAADVLRKVPMLSVDLDGNLSMRGSQNIRVLINNKPSTITAGSVADALKQIPADMIKSVEVITSPSAKYDAEGSGGIINIITKKNTLEGFSLNTDISAGTRGSNLGLNGSYRKGKMGFSLGGFGRSGYNILGSFENKQSTLDSLGNTVLSLQQADTQNKMLMGRYTLGWDYDINKNNYMNASVQLGTFNMNMLQDNLQTQTFVNGNFLNSSLRNVDMANLSATFDANLNYTHTFSKPGQEFSILTQYSRNNQTNNFINTILNEELTTESQLKNINESYNQEVTVELNYQTPIGKNQLLEVGGKDIMRKVISDFTYYTAEGENGEFVPVNNNSLTNVFNYNQNIMAGYLSYTWSFLKDYSLKAGTRYEYTTITADLENETEGFKIPSYGVLVPSINLSKKLKNGNTLKAAYNRRIQRPSLQFLNPNIQASNPLNITVGNPDLNPEYTNNFELSYGTFIKSTSLNFSAFARNTTGSIQSIRDVLEGDIIRTTYQNIGSENAYGMSVFANVNLSNKFSLNGGTDVYYAMQANNVADPLYNASNQGLVYSLRGFGNYNLSNGWGLQLFGFYRGRQVQLQGYRGGFGIYSLSVKKDFANKKGSIGFGAENFLTSAIKMHSELNSPVLDQSSTNVMRNMSFKVNLSYRIGKMNVGTPKRRKSVNNDDLKGGESNAGQETSSAPMGGGTQPQSSRSGQGQMPASGSPASPGTLPKATSLANVGTSAKGTGLSTDSTQAGQIDSAAITGKWTGKLAMFDATLNLKAEAAMLTGTMSTPMGEMAITNGKINGSAFSFTLSVNGNELRHEGTVENGRMLLSTELEGNLIKGSFTKTN
ncbi:TonB-dependent receptor [Rhodocytophaga aerolata]|uniref:TonB-dependent receptor n=1 Tax=Rhodocytophaga aerolata TaxID=455078 RepID=A0ABT8RFQ9_9BACT|nr:TonB-dependent receptor [Rhodocytophaga aerolata]MDO1450946.1 TonB-dependent receptor [Rhodocytophaga aerolata]